MKIIACCKATPEEQDILVNADGSLNFDRAAWKMGSYDLNTVEAARQLADAGGGEVIGLSVGGEALGASKLRKDVISRGLDSFAVVSGADLAALDTYSTAQLLAAAIQEQGDVDLVLCGAGSSDEYTQQVGNQLGALLGFATLNAVNKITPPADGAKAITVERVLESEAQTIEVGLPAVLSLTSSINTPRIAGMKDILAAGKKETTESSAATYGKEDAVSAPATKAASVLAPQQTARGGEILEGDTAEVCARFVELLSAKLR